LLAGAGAAAAPTVSARAPDPKSGTPALPPNVRIVVVPELIHRFLAINDVAADGAAAPAPVQAAASAAGSSRKTAAKAPAETSVEARVRAFTAPIVCTH
jgi:hypothetical protein